MQSELLFCELKSEMAKITLGEVSATSSQDPAELLERQNEARFQEIERDVKSNPLTSEQQPVSILKEEYAESANNNHFIVGVDALMKDYAFIRRVRGDGNCYYRAFLYNLVEGIRRNPLEGERILQWRLAMMR
jgi:ubiquitin thioesterase protein OTUB1